MDDFEVGKKYVISVAIQFEGEFLELATDRNGTVFAIFQQNLPNRYGAFQYRKVPLNKIIDAKDAE